ncbi:hypothetical protein BGZ54_004163 [Gamsiella multidivaricata]|nr:hypothetical protein BGZ54_004163 [Gamsiella multidivaricata]
MSPARRKALQARIQAINYIDRRRTQGPEAVLLLQTADDTVLRVGSFTNPSDFYEVKVDWTKGAVGQFSSCTTCPDFSNTKLCCKHIALVTIELPYTEFYYDGHWEVRGQSLLMDPSLDQAGFSASTAPATPTATQLAIHYIQGLSNMLNIMDNKHPLSNHEEVLDALRKTCEVCDKHIPVLATHELSHKRARQR